MTLNAKKMNGFQNFSKDILLTQSIEKKWNCYQKSTTFGSIKIPSNSQEKYSWTFYIESCNGQIALGICDKRENRTNECFCYQKDNINYAYKADGKIYSRNASEKYSSGFKKGDEIKMILDLKKKQLSFVKNNNKQNKAYNDVIIKDDLEYIMAVYMGSLNDRVSIKVNCKKISNLHNDEEKVSSSYSSIQNVYILEMKQEIQDLQQRINEMKNTQHKLNQELEEKTKQTNGLLEENSNLNDQLKELESIKNRLNLSEQSNTDLKTEKNEYEHKCSQLIAEKGVNEFKLNQLSVRNNESSPLIHDHEEEIENPFDKLTSYFTEHFKSILVAFSWYTYIMFLLSMVFVDDSECSTDHIIVSSITFGLFLLLPFISMFIEIHHNMKRMTCQNIMKVVVETFVFGILMLTVDLRPFGCLLDETLVLQISVLVTGIFCFLVHTFYSKHNPTEKQINDECEQDNGYSEISQIIEQ